MCVYAQTYPIYIYVFMYMNGISMHTLTHAPLGLARVPAAVEPRQLLLQQLQAGVDVTQFQGHSLPDAGVAGGSRGGRLK